MSQRKTSSPPINTSGAFPRTTYAVAFTAVDGTGRPVTPEALRRLARSGTVQIFRGESALVFSDRCVATRARARLALAMHGVTLTTTAHFTF